MLKMVLGWITGPITSIGKSYMEAKANVEIRELEMEAKKELYNKEVKEAIIADNALTNKLVSNIMAEDRKSWSTAWVRPVTLTLAIIYWIIIAGSQMRWAGGAQVIPVTLDFPAGEYGQLLMYFPMGVIGTFTVMRPLEKITMFIKGVL